MNQVSCQRLFRYGGGDSSPPVSAPGWGWRGCKRTPKIFDSLKIWAKTLKSGKKWPPVFALTSKNGAQCLHKNTRDLILEVTPKRVLHDLCGRKFMGKSCTKTFRASLGKFVQNFAPQKFACFYTYDEKSWLLAIDRKLPRLFWLRTESRFWIGRVTALISTLSRICGLIWRIELQSNVRQVLRTLWKWLKKCGWKKSPKNSAEILCTVWHGACRMWYKTEGDPQNTTFWLKILWIWWILH